ncbi:hypothetical protein V4T56_004261 [Vibrio vulnificus]|nr:hypothetical protein [Vibrio vulnificus]EJO3996399.1 hypothetical protein [Vibrio vulnificus]
MIDVTVIIGKDGPYYPSSVNSVPRVGDYINLTSHTDMKDKLEPYHTLKVTKVMHNIIEFNPEYTSVVKEHHQLITLQCERV